MPTKLAKDITAGDSTPFWVATTNAVVAGNVAMFEAKQGDSIVTKTYPSTRTIPIRTAPSARDRLLSANPSLAAPLSNLTDDELTLLIHHITLDTSYQDKLFIDAIHARSKVEREKAATRQSAYTPLTPEQKAKNKAKRRLAALEAKLAAQAKEMEQLKEVVEQ